MRSRQFGWKPCSVTSLLLVPGASCLTFPSFRFFNYPLGAFIIPASRVDERRCKWFMNCKCSSPGGMRISEEGAEAAGPGASASPRLRGGGEFTGGGNQKQTGTQIQAQLACSLGPARLLLWQTKGQMKTTELAEIFPFFLLGK